MLRWYWYLCGSIQAKQTAPHPPTVFHTEPDDDDDAPA
jgi:hypothetical protein